MTTNEVLLVLLRSAILEHNPDMPGDTNVDWDELMDISSKQGVLAWVWDGICKLPIEQQPPRSKRINWALSAQEITDRYVKQRTVLKEIVGACNNNSMRVLVLKGVSLSELYPNPSLRPSGDLDLYFFGDYEKGNALFGNGDVIESDKHSEFIYHGVHIENHTTFLNLDNPWRCEVNQSILNNLHCSVLKEDGYYVLEPKSQFLFVLFHAMRHMEDINADFPLRSLVDIPFLIINNPQILSPQSCFDLVDRYNASVFFEFIVYYGEFILEVDLSNYHRGLITKDDGENVVELFYNYGITFNISDVASFADFINSVKKCISIHCWKTKFFHVKMMENIRLVNFFIHQFIKFQFGFPLNQPLMDSLKRRFKIVQQ